MSLILKTNYNEDFAINDSKKLGELKKMGDVPKYVDTNRIRRSNLYSFFTGTKEYDFSETYRIADTESFVSAALSKKKNLILKDGYKLVSENEGDIKYIKRRLNEIAFVTEKSFNELLSEVTNSILYNHNSFLYVARKEKSSTGSVRYEGSKKVIPIAGFFYIPETKIDLLENELNDVVGYRYNISRGIYNEFKKNEILHLALNKKPGLNVGTPPLEPVKDDILSLRQIEESLERLIYKLSIPLIHMKVGTEKLPAGKDRATGRLEVDIVNDMMLNMDEAGGITTSERVDIKMIGAESQALRLSSYIDHFKNRVLVGLTISDVDLGTGTSTTGGAASIVSEALRQNVEMYQTYIENFITDNMITPLLLEKESNSKKQYLEEEDKVLFRFNKTNADVKIKLESHYINEANASLITVDEYRVLTGRRALTAEEKNEFLKLAGKLPDGSNIPDSMHPDEKALAKAKISTSSTTAKKSTSKASKPKPKSSSNSTSNYTNPTNQHKKNLISDELNIESYLNNISDRRIEAANTLLTKRLHDVLNEAVIISIEDCASFVRPLTNTLQTYIIGKVPRDSVVKAVETLLCKNILEYIESDIKTN